MLVCGPLAQLMRDDIHESGVTCAPQNPTINHLAKELGKDCDDIEAQHPSKKSKIQKSFRRVDHNCLSRSVDFHDDRICQRYQSFLAALIDDDEDLGATCFHHGVDFADALGAYLNRASFEFPVVIMIRWYRNTF